jgi:hypothetical protein
VTITVTMDELRELETALTKHYHVLDVNLADSVNVGGPNNAGIQECIRRQKVSYLLNRLRLVQSRPGTLDHILDNSRRPELRTLPAARQTFDTAA